MTRTRCPWPKQDPLYVAYHDEEWGVPVHDDRLLFEFVVLEGAQAGLSWLTILRKRPAYRQAFDDFEPERVAAYGERKLKQLLENPGLVRNERKLRSAIRNAQAFVKVQAEFGSFDHYVWSFMEQGPLLNHWTSIDQVPASTPLSERISRDLIARGFNFVGPTIVYAHMQATGMVNDHLTSCFRHRELSRSGAGGR